MTIRTPILAIAAALLTIGAGGCSRSDPAPAETRNDDATPAPQERTDAAPETPATPPVSTPSAAPDLDGNAATVAEAPPEVAPAPDEQMLDDASATGMTARASRREPGGDAVEPVEQK